MLEQAGMTDAVFVLWGAVEDKWGKIQSGLAPEFEVTDSTDVQFKSDTAFLSVMFDLYMGPSKPLALVKEHRDKSYLPVITAKAKAIGSRRLRVLSTRYKGKGKPGEAADRVKARIRRVVPSRHDAPYKLNTNLHASDGPAELEYISDVLLNPNNLRHVHLRRQTPPREEFMDRLNMLRQWCTAERIDPRQVCVVSGGVLEACDIRASSDLDIVMTFALRRQGKGAPRKNVAPGVDIATEGYHWLLTDDELINDPANHFNVMGIKFASLPIVSDKKLQAARVKDTDDRRLLRRPDIKALVDSVR